MERIGLISRRVLAGLVAGNDNRKGAGFDSATSPAKASTSGECHPLSRVEEKKASAEAPASDRRRACGKGDGGR
jgi:hypothetical protein